MVNKAVRAAVLSGMAIALLELGPDKALASPPSVLLTIDDSNLSAVTITATGAKPIANSGTIAARVGIDLANFFTRDQESLTFGTFNGGTLIGGNSGIAYNDVWSDNYSTSGGSYLDLSLYVDSSLPGGNNLQNFSTSQSAFTGTWTIDFASMGLTLADIPTPGAEGNIFSGFSGEPGVLIGTWQIAPVPEPTTLSFLALGALMIGTTLYRHRS
jgi:hypothetical protein